jgi:hypothetical protein
MSPNSPVTGSLADVATIGAPVGTAVGTIVGHPPTGLLFLIAGASDPDGITMGTVGYLDATGAIGAPACTAAGAASPWATAAIAGAPA